MTWYLCTNCDFKTEDAIEPATSNPPWSCPRCQSQIRVQENLDERVCDFCSNPNPPWVYDVTPWIAAPPVSSPELGGMKLPPQVINTAWAACATCSDYIEDERIDKLTERANAHFRKKHGPGMTEAILRRLNDHHRRLHLDFASHRIGPRMAPAQYERLLEQRQKSLPVPEKMPPLYASKKRPWSEVLHLRTMMHDWWESSEGRTFGYTIDKAMDERRILDFGVDHNTAAQEAARFKNPVPFWVSEDMRAMIMHASTKLPPDPLTVDSLPTHHGFVVFEKGIACRDVSGKPMVFRGILWSQGYIRRTNKYGLRYTLYGDKREPAITANYPQAQYVSAPLIPLSLGSWAYGDNYLVAHELMQPWMRYLQAFFLLVQQPLKLMAVAEADADRPAERRAQRQVGPKLEVPRTQVITLRRVKRAEPSDGQLRDVAWTHRWLVEGHWRNQPYPKEGVRKRIWIEDYIKGPENLPFVPKERIYRFIR